MNKLFILLLGFLTMTSNSYGIIRGSGLEFEELIPRDEYNPKNLGIVKGRVLDIIRVPKINGYGDFLIAVFNTTKGKVYTVLGPDWYMKNQKFDFKLGDALIIRGSKIDYSEKIIVIATEVSNKERTIKLREKADGKAEWKSWRDGERIFYKNYTW